jgi:predicted acyl esterase
LPSGTDGNEARSVALIRTVTFASEDDTVEALLLTPDGDNGPFPAVVMAGGWCYVKELIQPEYAKYFVDAGYACLILDYRRFGGSTGQPRQHLVPEDQQEDYKNAISYLETLEGIDGDRIGIWGISYSGGHVLAVGATDPRVKCIVSNIPVVDGYVTMRNCHGAMKFRELEAHLLEDRRKRASSGEHGIIGMSGHPDDGLFTWPFPEVRPVFEKLKATSAPAHEHWNTVASVEYLLGYSVYTLALRIINTPTLMIVADHDDITQWDKEIEVFHSIPSVDKKLVVVGGTTHMTLYSDLNRLEVAASEAAAWFKAHL